MQSNDVKWFPAKKYGWGWGLPTCWEGWVVMIVWMALVVAGSIVLAKHLLIYIAYAFIMGAVFFVICLLKGEKPRWRWGKD